MNPPWISLAAMLAGNSPLLSTLSTDQPLAMQAGSIYRHEITKSCICSSDPHFLLGINTGKEKRNPMVPCYIVGAARENMKRLVGASVLILWHAIVSPIPFSPTSKSLS